MLASVELGLGGVWLLCPPRLLFVPDRNHDDRPDGPAEVVLDGFSVPAENYHTFANGLKWGPDGWLYGQHRGASSPGQIGPPGTPEALRVPIRGGIWRYHPQQKRFEALAHGTTNPWGHDWNALGELFFVNTVNGHLWHMIPGARTSFVRTRLIRIRGNYAQIDQHADHWHWDQSKELILGAPGAGDSDLGGGHAHSGASIYLGDQWPAAYRDRLLTLNFHGRRVNVERLYRFRSGYAGGHERDILHAADRWFRGIDLSYGPDGSVFILDWSDTGDCHDHDGVHRDSGRIYKVSFGDPARKPAVDVSRLAERELAALHRHSNEWYVRQARRELATRSARGEALADARSGLADLLRVEADPVLKLRAIWSLYVIGGLDRKVLFKLLDHEHESIRAWAIRLLTDGLPIDSVFSHRIGQDVEPPEEVRDKLNWMARDDASGLVRLVLASTLQRLPLGRRTELAHRLLSHAEDNWDPNLPAARSGQTSSFRRWQMTVHADSLLFLAAHCPQPVVVRLIARRLGEEVDSHPARLSGLLSAASDRATVFRIAGSRWAGRRTCRNSQGREAGGLGCVSSQARYQGRCEAGRAGAGLNVIFGDGQALDEVKRLA